MLELSSTFAIPFGLRQLIAAFLSRFVWVFEGLVQRWEIQKCGEKQRNESGDESPQSKDGKSRTRERSKNVCRISLRERAFFRGAKDDNPDP